MLGKSRGRECAQVCAQDSVVLRGPRTALDGCCLLLQCTGAGGGDGYQGINVPGVSCPKQVSPQTLSYAQGGDPCLPPRKAKFSTTRRDCSPCPDPARMKTEQTLNNDDHETSPVTPRPPDGIESPPGRTEQAGRSRKGEETQRGERVKSLRRRRWKITLAPSRPLLLQASRSAIFLRS